ncbi:ribosome modulation factor [Echinimonas agarilytica]|uniref:Ribosome modulation factor n=1 Tax=Echinimonas agarilytica TaxID=1215918 RepID=A0AA42B934_9GAMM|nr:ribosome modulation factor [Echinimonas agarilytica]MCM2681173.1 ribosome modulation factor [Echinimonas agarilytica]
MKRQKRDRLQRAEALGHKAGLLGRSRDDCPYQGLNARSSWFGGWRSAMNERAEGLFR